MQCQNCEHPAQQRFGGCCCYLCCQTNGRTHGEWCTSNNMDPGPHNNILDQRIKKTQSELANAKTELAIVKRDIKHLKYSVAAVTIFYIVRQIKQSFFQRP